MVTAIVLVRAEIQRIPEVAEEIAQIHEVSEVYSVTGEFDLVAMVRVRMHDELADVIPGKLNKVQGVTHTETHIAFRTYSRHDLDAAFSLGLGAVLPGLLDFAGGCVLVAHNAPFDLGFLIAGCGDCGLAWPGFTVLDTVMLARHVMDPDEVPDCKLGTLAGFFGARTVPNHRALADARATADVLGWLIRRLTHRGVRTLRQLSTWPDVVA